MEYISDPYALILLTSSLEIDWDIASNAAELVSKAKAAGRCVGKSQFCANNYDRLTFLPRCTHKTRPDRQLLSMDRYSEGA